MILGTGCRRTRVLPRDRAAIVVVARGDVEVASWPLAAPSPLDLSVVDELARLQLAARRVGCSILLRHASAELTGLLAFLGLADVVPDVGPGAPLVVRLPPRVEEALQVCGQTEDGEEGRVEEVVVSDDPVA